jgi:hypothetical protein
VRAIIDISGLPGVAQYYRMFPREPSINPGLDMRITRRIEIANINLERVLDAILGLPDEEREVLIVAHGIPQGFYMPVAAGSRITASKANLPLLSRAGAALDEAAAIRSALLPVEQQGLRWRALLRQLPGVVVAERITVEQAARTLDNWLRGLARSWGIGLDRLRALIDKMQRVRRRQLRRVEIRACNMGRDPEALEILRTFLGTARCLAPRVTFFYVLVRPNIIEDPNRFEQLVRAHAGPVGGGVYAGRVGPSSRAFDVAVPAQVRRGRRMVINAPVGFMIEGGFVLRIWETSLRPHRFGSLAVALSWTCVERWVSSNVMMGSGYRGRGPFYLVGFWTFGAGGQPYVVPQERAYRAQIVSAPAAGRAGR